MSGVAGVEEVQALLEMYGMESKQIGPCRSRATGTNWGQHFYMSSSHPGLFLFIYLFILNHLYMLSMLICVTDPLIPPILLQYPPLHSSLYTAHDFCREKRRKRLRKRERERDVLQKYSRKIYSH